MAKGSLARIHPVTSEYVFFHFSAILAVRICMKPSVSWPKTLSMDTTSGVNDTRRASADDRIEAISLF